MHSLVKASEIWKRALDNWKRGPIEEIGVIRLSTENLLFVFNTFQEHQLKSKCLVHLREFTASVLRQEHVVTMVYLRMATGQRDLS